MQQQTTQTQQQTTQLQQQTTQIQQQEFNPADLTYTTIKCEGNEALTLDYAIQSSSIAGLVPWYGDAGNTLALQFSADAGVVSDVTINGELAGDIVTEKAPGVVKVNPTRFDDNAYSVIKVTLEDGEFVFVVRKGTPTDISIPVVTTDSEAVTSSQGAVTTLSQDVTTPETTPEATTPEATTPEATTPETTTPKVTTPEVTTPETTTPEVTTPETTTPKVTTSETKTTTAASTTKNPTTTVVSSTKVSAGTVSVGKTKIKKVKKNFASPKAKISLKKISGAKYQIKVSTTKKFKKKKTVTKMVKKATFTIKNKKIKNRKVLYVKARAYRIVDGITYYGKWSKVKKVKIK